jgi:hypothetical protein
MAGAVGNTQIARSVLSPAILALALSIASPAPAPAVAVDTVRVVSHRESDDLIWAAILKAGVIRQPEATQLSCRRDPWRPKLAPMPERSFCEHQRILWTDRARGDDVLRFGKTALPSRALILRLRIAH